MNRSEARAVVAVNDNPMPYILVSMQPPRSNGKTTLFTKQTYIKMPVIQRVALM